MTMNSFLLANLHFIILQRIKKKCTIKMEIFAKNAGKFYWIVDDMKRPGQN